MSSIEGTDGRMMVFAHRGASGAAPENTMAAFEQASEKGADGIELDVHMSADGEVVVIHDARLERTSDGSGEVAYMNYAELEKFDMGAKWKGSPWGFQRIPLLEEVISLAKSTDMMLNIELKGYKANPRLAEATAKIVQENGFEADVIFSSFDIGQLRRTKVALPQARLAYITFFPPQPQLGVAEDLWGCHPNHSLTTKLSVRKWQEAGMHVQLWTVNSKEAILRAIRIGVDGIITNHPALALSIIGGKIR